MTEEPKARLSPSPSTGLTAEEVREQEARGLKNTQPLHNTKTVGQIIRDNTLTLFNLFNFALAAAIALVGSYENLLFLLVILLNILVGIVQEIRSKRMVEKLSVISMPRARVVRDGREQEIPVEDLVLDDITVHRMGGQICADAIVAEGEIEVNEALLTGEAEPVRKQPGDWLLSGSFVVSGHCRARVEHIGADNYATKIALDAKKYKKVRSELMNALDKIVKFTSFFILPLGALLFLHSYFVLDNSLQETVTTTSAALLGMLPKGLVLLTSVSLVVGVIKLAKQQTLVQELFCIENLSRVDMLCLDKTGTITQGRMKVSDVLPLTGAPPFEIGPAVGSFVDALQDSNATFVALQERFPRKNDWKPIARTPFSSARKWSSVTFRGEGTVLVGAPEILLRGRAFALPPEVARREEAGCRVVTTAKGLVDVNLVMTASKQFAEKHPEALETVVRVEREADEWIKANWQEAVAIGAKEHGISLADAEKLAGWSHYYGVLTDADVKGLEADQKFLIENGLMTTPVDVKSIVLPIALGK